MLVMAGQKQNRLDLKRYLTIGMKLSGVINFGPKEEYSFHCTFIGMKERQFLIFELSAKSMEELITRRTNNVDVVIKGVADTEFGHIFAFRSQIIGIKSLVGWLMFVRYPTYTEIRKIRDNKRYKVAIDARLKLEQQTVAAQIVNLSVSGCGLLVPDGVMIEAGTEVSIVPAIKHMPDTIPKCTVVNNHKEPDGTVLGIAFDSPVDVTEELKLEVLENFIQQRELV
jgi:c-di-GMP-binding flagellar brake protein YcgR